MQLRARRVKVGTCWARSCPSRALCKRSLSLRHCYDKPHLIHQAHILANFNIMSLIDGNGKELWQFHDVANQHLWALKVTKHNSFKSLVTTILEAKVDQTTLREFQRYSRDNKDVPPFLLLLKFVNLEARNTENTIRVKQNWPAVTLDKKTNSFLCNHQGQGLLCGVQGSQASPM